MMVLMVLLKNDGFWWSFMMVFDDVLVVFKVFNDLYGFILYVFVFSYCVYLCGRICVCVSGKLENPVLGWAQH